MQYFMNVKIENALELLQNMFRRFKIEGKLGFCVNICLLYIYILRNVWEYRSKKQQLRTASSSLNPNSLIFVNSYSYTYV